MVETSRLDGAPDYRSSPANECTFLVWIRTAPDFLAANVDPDQLAPNFATPLIHEVPVLLLYLFTGGMTIYDYLR